MQRDCPTPNSAPTSRGSGAPRGGFSGSGYRERNAAKCYKCGGPNHFARDCQAQATKCYACGKLGHISRECPAPNAGSVSSGKTCYRCGETGHISRDCPQGAEINGSAPAAAPAADSEVVPDAVATESEAPAPAAVAA